MTRHAEWESRKRVTDAVDRCEDEDVVGLACLALEHSGLTPEQLRRVLRALACEVDLPEPFGRWMDLDARFAAEADAAELELVSDEPSGLREGEQ